MATRDSERGTSVRLNDEVGGSGTPESESDDSIESLAARCRTLAQAAGSIEAQQDAERMRRRIAASEARVALLGATSRGKSRLVNRFLGRTVLAEGAAGVTTRCIEIRHGTPEGIDLEGTGSIDGRSPLSDEESRTAMLRSPDATAPAVYLDDPWLKDVGCVLIDAPGFDNQDPALVGAAYEALGVADVVVMVIAATSPVDASEQQLLAELAGGRRPRRFCVVVSMLDRIEGTERESVLRQIGRRVHRVHPAASVIPADDVATVKVSLNQLVAEFQRERVADLRSQLIEDLRALIAHLKRRAAAAALDAEERREALRRTEQQVEQLRLQEAMILERLNQRGVRRVSELEGRLDSALARVADSLISELDEAPEPDEWWESRMPEALSQRFLALAPEIESDLESAIRSDARWLEHELGEVLGVDVGVAGTGDVLAIPSIREADKIVLSATDWRSIVAAAHALISWLVELRGRGTAATRGALVAGRNAVERRGTAEIAASQRAKMRRELARMMREAARRSAADLAQPVRLVYQQLGAVIEERQAARLHDMRAVLAEPEASGSVDESLRDAEHLLHDLEGKVG